ncbi:MAG: SUMF1/EgtB/PvdO family nonheme iron enzyme [Saprospirales bacterium]|nr:SUMF1/EgtB/PvdO family nonheme iron enzyme [Saprospirales bacterium]
MADLNELKPGIKDILIEQGLGPALQRLKAALPEGSKAYNELILLEADLKDANLKMVRGSISQEDLDVKYNQLRERFLILLESLEDSDLESAAGGKEPKHGSLLYQIPGRMELEKEARCRVRIAYDEAALLENIELTRDTRIKDVRIAEVMEVELIDPAENPAFSIRTFNRTEQFIEREEYTEWLFFVKPLREGQFPLLLRVSVIEKVGEKERVRDIVLEETVVIVAESVEDPGGEAFKASGYSVGEVAEPLTPQAEPRKRKPIQSAAFALIGLIAFSGIAYAFSPAFRMNVDWFIATLLDNKESYQAFADRFEGKSRAQQALEKIEEIDWNKVLEAPTLVTVEEFLETYPQGKFSEKAVELLVTLNFEASLKESSRKAIEDYLVENPDSEFAPQAREKLAFITEPIDSSASSVPETPAPETKPSGGKAPVKMKEAEKISKPVQPLDTSAELLAPDYFAFVKGGTFTMGCTPEQGADCEGDEKPAHSVKVRDFFIGRQEVTNAEFCAFLNEKGNQSEGGGTWLNAKNSYVKIEKKGAVFSPKKGFEKHPVIAVSWHGANAYCAWMSEKTQLQFRLPTEAEWEYAARGGKQSNGRKYANSESPDDAGWYSANAGKGVNPVGMKKPNELGIYDLSGNVWEWCSDWYGEYSDKKLDKPAGPPEGSNRVRRGGCWRDQAEDCRISNRSGSPPSTRLDYVGFRVARTP